ncbi:hypothetical protein F5Y03DRAFT_286746 [Xylaria venustula]|nr:hypothetical protein F5Y03DRAFT_286746 [Xylaria venustula]
MVQHKKNSHNSTNGNTSKELPRMSFPKREMPDNRSAVGNGNKGTNKSNGTSSNFRTDAAISSSRSNRERVLQPWVAPTDSEGVDMTLEKSTSGRPWDQFAANERQFGIKTTYDENIYTTAIDKSHPQYKERLAKADKAAKEIEGSATTTAHHAEERQMNFAGGDDAGDDEEDKYSGVKRQDFPALGNRDTKYTPPARRAPTAASTVKGAPVDPAIISSQLRTQKPQATPKQEDNKVQSTSVAEPAQPIQTPEPKSDGKAENLPKSVEVKPTNQTSTPLKPSAATSRTMSPQAKDAQSSVPNATATVERDVLKEFKSFAQQQRMNVDKARHTRARADKEVKLIELKRFATNFKLPTPVPLDLIGIIAKDPAKQREIQERAARDVLEVAQRKADEAKEKEKKEPIGSSTEPQPTITPAAPVENRTSRAANTSSATGPSAPVRNQGGRVPPNYPTFPNNRSGPQHITQAGRQGGLTHRIRESQKSQAQEMRMPPTGPANAMNPPFTHRMTNHLGAKLNPNSHEFRPNAFAPSFSPNGHPSTSSSPRSAINHANGPPASTTTHISIPIVIHKKGRTPDPKKCNIMAFAKTIQPPETKNWSENGNFRPPYDTPPTWRSVADDEKPDSTMHLTCDEFFERQPFASQPTPNPPHLVPQHTTAHQHQLPLHMQHGAHNAGPRHSPHAPPVQMHGAQHNPVPHTPFNGADEHRMIHSNSNQSFSSPRMGHQVPMAYPATMHSTPQIPYGQHMMHSFMGPGAPQMNSFNRSLSNNTQFMAQQSAPMMMQPHFMAPAGMVTGPAQMHMYPGGQSFIPPGSTPQPIPGAANGYSSPGRPSAPMMVPGGSSQGQMMYAQSPSMPYQQPYAPQQGQINNMRPSYNGAGTQQYGSSPQQVHQYTGPPHRNGSGGYNKNYQSHNQNHGPSTIPTGPQGRTSEGPDEAK